MKITILGGGSFGTSMACQLAHNPKNQITLLVRNSEKAEEITQLHTNSTYFPNRILPNSIKATTDYDCVDQADILMLAIPTKTFEGISDKLKLHLRKNTLVVNLAKGILKNGETLVEYYSKEWEHPNFVTMKGASFSAEMINGSSTLFTLGFSRKQQLDLMLEATEGTSLYFDFTNDIRGVELLSAVKNIYAIALGKVDAQYNSLNTRFLVLTKAIEEIKTIVRLMKGREETVFLSCGIGDISLTGLSDLSRNRTLGLLIGKGFYHQKMTENSVILEGQNTLNMLIEALPADIQKRLPLFNEVKKMLLVSPGNNEGLDFPKLFKRNYKTVLTYGTFDLLHFGHLELLRRIRELGDRVIVGLSTDEFNEIKGKKCVMPYRKRKHLLEVLRYVDLVIPESNWEQKVEDIKNYQVDLFVMGEDWKGKFDFLKEYCEVIYLPRTKGISTTQLKGLLNK